MRCNNNDCVLLQMTCRDFNIGEQGCKYGQSCKFKHACSKKIAPSKVSYKLKEIKLLINVDCVCCRSAGATTRRRSARRGRSGPTGSDGWRQWRGTSGNIIVTYFICGGLG